MSKRNRAKGGARRADEQPEQQLEQVEQPESEQAESEQAEHESKPATYRVAPGNTVSSLRGDLGPGESVSTADMSGDQREERLVELARRGVLVRS